MNAALASLSSEIRFGQSEADYRRFTLGLLCLLVVVTGMFGRALNPVFINDQAEMLVLSQSFEWVYDEQPPLYAWMARYVLAVSGGSVFALDALKYGFLIGGLLRYWALASRLSDWQGVGFLAIALGVTLPTIGEDALGEATHSVALIAFSVWAAFIVISNLEKPSRWLWLVLGLTWGLGLAFKHTMAIVALSQIIAAAGCARSQRGMLIGHMVIAAVIMAALNSPFFLMLLHAQASLDNGLREFHMAEMPWAFMRGLFDLVTSVLNEAAVVIVVGTGLFFTRGRTATQTAPDTLQARQFLLISVAAFLAIFAVMIVATGTSVVRDRWLAPALIWLAPVVAAGLTGRLGARGRHLLVTASLGLVIVNSGYRAIEANLMAMRGDINSATIDYETGARTICAQAEDADFILTVDASWAANLYRQSGVPTAYPNGYVPPVESDIRRVLIVWIGEGNMPEPLQGVMARVGTGWRVEPCRARLVQVPLRNADEGDPALFASYCVLEASGVA